MFSCSDVKMVFCFAIINSVVAITLKTINNARAEFFGKHILNHLSTNFSKWSNTLKQFVGNLPTNCLSVFGHLVGLAFKWLK